MFRHWLKRLWWRSKPTPEPHEVEDLVRVVIGSFIGDEGLTNMVKLLDGLDKMGEQGDRDGHVVALAQGFANPNYPADHSERLAFVLISSEFRDQLRREIAVRRLRPGRVV